MRHSPCIEVAMSVQSVNDSTDTPLTFDAPTLDELAVSFATAARLTFPATAHLGFCFVSLTLEYAANATGARECILVLRDSGDVEKQRTASRELTCPATGACCLQVTDLLLDLEAGDYLEATARQESGGALNVSGTLQLIRLDMASRQFRGGFDNGGSTIANNTSVTTTPQTPTVDDLSALIAPASTNKKWNLPAGYSMIACLGCEFAANASHSRSFFPTVYTSGAVVKTRNYSQRRASPAGVSKVAATLSLHTTAAGDYIDAGVHQNSGVALTLSSGYIRLVLLKCVTAFLGGASTPATTTSGVEDLWATRSGVWSATSDTIGAQLRADATDTTLTLPSPGKYILIANAGWSNNANGYREFTIYHRRSDGGLARQSRVRIAPTTSLNSVSCYAPQVLICPDVLEGDYLQIGTLQTSGGSLSSSPGLTNAGITILKII